MRGTIFSWIISKLPLKNPYPANGPGTRLKLSLTSLLQSRNGVIIEFQSGVIYSAAMVVS